MLARRDTRTEAARVRRLSPLQTVEDQSQAWGLCCHSCTWREGFAPSWQTELQGSYLPCGLPGSRASFQPTGRTSMNAVLMVQPHADNTCSTASSVPNTTRCLTLTRRRLRVALMTCAERNCGRGIQRGFG